MVIDDDDDDDDDEVCYVESYYDVPLTHTGLRPDCGDQESTCEKGESQISTLTQSSDARYSPQ